MQAVIMAGGLGTRMYPHTRKVPKSLLRVSGRCFIDLQLELLRAGGVENVVLCVGHLGNLIQRHVGNGSHLNLNVTYSLDGSSPRGTGGALRRAVPLLDSCFLLTWGDSYVRVDYRKMFDIHGGDRSDIAATMCVFPNHDRYGRSNACVSGSCVTYYSKIEADRELTHIDAGVSVVSRSAVEEIATSEIPVSLDDYFKKWATTGRLAAYQVSERFYEVGSPSGLVDFASFTGEKQFGHVSRQLSTADECSDPTD